MSNRCKITYLDLVNAIHTYRYRLYFNNPETELPMSLDIHLCDKDWPLKYSPYYLKIMPTDVKISFENSIDISFTVNNVAETKSEFYFTDAEVFRINTKYDGMFQRAIGSVNTTIDENTNAIDIIEYYVLYELYNTLVNTTESTKSSHVEIDEEEYAKHHTDNIKSLPAVNSFTDDRTLDDLIDLTSDDGLFTLEINAAEADGKKKDEYKITTLAFTTIRMSDYSDKESFLNHIRNIISREFPKVAEVIFDKYYDAIPKEEDLTTKISNILREAGVDESKIPDTAIALIDTMIFPDDE